MGVKVLGLDISLNHGAAVELTNGKISNFFYYTTLAGSAKQSKRGTRIPPKIFKIKDKHILGISRLFWLRGYIEGTLDISSPDYVGIEDYAIRAEQGAHYLGEAGGQARISCWERNIKLRLHDPTSVKMYAAHDGTCQKDAIQRAVKNRWNVDFSIVDQPSGKITEKNPNPKQNRQTSEDLCDAYAIAMLVWTEIQLRNGNLLLSNLHEKEIRVFNRTTKTFAINLLNREWIVNTEGEE